IARSDSRRRQEPQAGLLGETRMSSLATVAAHGVRRRSEMRFWSILGNSQKLDGRTAALVRCGVAHRTQRFAPKAGAAGRVAWRDQDVEPSNRRRPRCAKEI